MSSSIIDPLDKYRNYPGHIPMALPESNWTKIKNAASKVFESVATISKSPLSSLKSIFNLSVLATSTVAATTAIKTVLFSGLDAIFTKSFSPLSKVVTLSSYMQNIPYGLGMFLLYYLIAPIVRNLAHDEEIQPPYIPNNPLTALKIAYLIGKNSVKPIATWGTGSYIFASLASPGLATLVFSALWLKSTYDLIQYMMF